MPIAPLGKREINPQEERENKVQGEGEREIVLIPYVPLSYLLCEAMIVALIAMAPLQPHRAKGKERAVSLSLALSQ